MSERLDWHTEFLVSSAFLPPNRCLRFNTFDVARDNVESSFGLSSIRTTGLAVL